MEAKRPQYLMKISNVQGGWVASSRLKYAGLYLGTFERNVKVQS